MSSNAVVSFESCAFKCVVHMLCRTALFKLTEHYFTFKMPKINEDLGRGVPISACTVHMHAMVLSFFQLLLVLCDIVAVKVCCSFQEVLV